MQQLISFLQKYKYLLFFLILQSIAIGLTINNNNFHKSKFISSANFFSGGLYEKSSNISDYFNLKERNEELSTENEKLKNILDTFLSDKDSSYSKIVIDTAVYNQKYVFTSAKIIKNDYTQPFNVLLIDKGKKDSILKEMAVFNSKGIIGITEKTTNKYTRVQSILNRNSQINARLKNNSNHFGSLSWDGKDYKTVQLTDIPRQANVKIGDTIITGGKSAIFPEGILIGTITETNNGTSANNKLSVRLFNDMSNLRHVYVVKNLDKLEIKSLENE